MAIKIQKSVLQTFFMAGKNLFTFADYSIDSLTRVFKDWNARAEVLDAREVYFLIPTEICHQLVCGNLKTHLAEHSYGPYFRAHEFFVGKESLDVMIFKATHTYEMLLSNDEEVISAFIDLSTKSSPKHSQSAFEHAIVCEKLIARVLKHGLYESIEHKKIPFDSWRIYLKCQRQGLFLFYLNEK